MSNKTFQIPQERQLTLARCIEIITAGPSTAEAIGEALWQVESRQLYLQMLSSMKSFIRIYTTLSLKKAANIIEQWKSSKQGRAVIGQQPVPDVKQQVKQSDAASTTSAASKRSKAITVAHDEPPPAATNAPAGSTAAPAVVGAGSESSSASRHGQRHQNSVLPGMNYEDHSINNGLSLMEAGDLNELAERIKNEGLKEDITLFEGKILDGRNRYRACKIAGITPKFKEFEAEYPDQSPWDFVWDKNLSRLHLDKGQRGMARLYLEEGAGKWQEEHEKQADEANKARSNAAKGNRNAAKDRPKNGACSKRAHTDSSGKTRKARAQRAGVSAATMAKCEELKKHAPDLAEKVLAGKMGIAKALKELKRRQHDEKMRKAKEQAQQQDPKDRFDIRHCSMQELFASSIKPDLCVTDPSCREKDLHMYGELAKRCVDANVPLVAVMCGQSYLPEVLSLMTPHIHYLWTMAYLTPGGEAAQVEDRKINTLWKPVLLFGKGTRDWIGDLVKSAVNDKDWHQWGQSTSGMVDLIKRLIGNADPGELLVCDPFLAAGTTAVACMELGLKFVGCDSEQKNVENTRLRLENL